MRPVFRLGLTGGIGSGKSTVAGMLSRLGAAVIDADAIARKVTAPGGSAIDKIRFEFGSEFITPDGALDREKMRALAFSDASARTRLEAIVHPLVGAKTARQTQSAIDQGHCFIVHDVPLLVESPAWRQRVDQVLVVDCTAQVQVERTMQRSGLTRSAIENIISAQASRLARLAAADMVIFNAGLSLDDLALEVAQIARRFGL